MNFVKSFFYIIALGLAGIAFGLLSPLLFILSVLSPSVRQRVTAFSDRFENQKEDESIENDISPILYTIYDILDTEAQLYEDTPKVMIVCENVDLLQSIQKEHESLECSYEFRLMALSAYTGTLENRDATYSYYYIGTDISIQPPVGVLESFYFNVVSE